MRCLSLLVCVLAAGCTSGVDDSIPPTLDAINEIQEIRQTEHSASGEGGLASTDGVPRSGVFQVEFVTTEGRFVMEIHRDWAPIGADRFYRLVKDRFFDDSAFFRVVSDFVVQFGLPADPAALSRWSRNLKDEPVIEGNRRGYVTFAKASMPNSRSTQLFINLKDNSNLDAMGFAAIGRVIEGMDVVDRLNAEYGEAPDQGRIRAEGNAYLRSRFPSLSWIQTARVIEDDLADDGRIPSSGSSKDSS